MQLGEPSAQAGTDKIDESLLCSVLLDDALHGKVARTRVNVRYQDGTSETQETDASGVVDLRRDRGMWADLELDFAGRTHVRRLFLLYPDISQGAGQWRRLANLGYVHEATPPSAAPSIQILAAALERFQSDHGLLPTGVANPVTVGKLGVMHACFIEWRELPARREPPATGASRRETPKETAS